MHLQSGRTDCGLIATAFVLHAAMRKNFKTICFEQILMRQHLLECLQNEALTEFPQSTSPSAKPRRSNVSHIVINLFLHMQDARILRFKYDRMKPVSRLIPFQMCGAKKKEHYLSQLGVYKMFLVHLTV